MIALQTAHAAQAFYSLPATCQVCCKFQQLLPLGAGGQTLAIVKTYLYYNEGLYNTAFKKSQVSVVQT